MRTPYDKKIRHISWLLKSVRIRQVARRACDLTRIGDGTLERLCSALIMGAAFFFASLVAASLAGSRPSYVIGIALIALVSVMFASGILVLWKSDSELEAEVPRLKSELSKLREAAAQEREDRLVEEEQRQAEEKQRQTLKAAEPKPTMKRCPYCRENILIRAIKCKHCGEILDEDLRAELIRENVIIIHPQRRWNPGVAAVLSFFWPGLGQMYKGQVFSGFAWMFLVPLGYICCLFPGFFLHVICIFGAASGSD